MSVQAVRWAIENPHKGPAQAVLLVLAWHAEQDRTVQLSIPRIADEAGLSPRAVQSALYKLIDWGVIGAERQKNRVTTYILIHAPRASGTTRITTDAPRASTESYRKALEREFRKGVRIGQALERAKHR